MVEMMCTGAGKAGGGALPAEGTADTAVGRREPWVFCFWN